VKMESSDGRSVQDIIHGQSSVHDGSSILFDELLGRMSKCEHNLAMNDKEIAQLQYDIQEVQRKLDEKLIEIDFLKTEDNKNSNWKQVELQIENLTLKGIIFEQKVQSLENLSILSKEQIDDNQVKLTEVKGEVESLQNSLDEKIKSKSSDESLEELQLSITDEVNDLSYRISTVEKQIENKCNTFEEKMDRSDSRGWKEEVEILRSHVTNIENILFHGTFDSSKDILLQWKLQDYQHHFDIGEEVYSPIFYIQINGYCFKLVVDWRGANKEKLYLGLQICRATYNNNEILQPYNIPFTLEMTHSNGSIVTGRVTAEVIEKHKEQCFSIRLESSVLNHQVDSRTFRKCQSCRITSSMIHWQ